MGKDDVVLSILIDFDVAMECDPFGQGCCVEHLAGCRYLCIERAKRYPNSVWPHIKRPPNRASTGRAEMQIKTSTRIRVSSVGVGLPDIFQRCLLEIGRRTEHCSCAFLAGIAGTGKDMIRVLVSVNLQLAAVAGSRVFGHEISERRVGSSAEVNTSFSKTRHNCLVSDRSMGLGVDRHKALEFGETGWHSSLSLELSRCFLWRWWDLRRHLSEG